jgi:sporulation protein YlmC with PRC-barrel domain
MISRTLIFAGVSVLALTMAGPSPATEKPHSKVERTVTPKTQQTSEVDAEKIIGRDLLDASNEKIGSIDSVMLGRDGKVQAVVVNAGGFLGLGERQVAIDWADIRVSDEGKRITTALTRDQLKALPEYRYADEQKRGTVFGTARRENDGSTVQAQGKDAPVVDASSLVAYRSKTIIGAKVVNAEGDSVGQVKELLIGANGMVRGALITTGGFLGLGERDVAVDWRDLTLARDGKNIRVTVNLNDEQLKALPEYAENR